MDENADTPPPDPRPATSPLSWTRADAYFAALARRRTERRRREPRPARTEPEDPRALLSTVPFLALSLALLVILVAIAILAWPGRDRPAPPPPEPELGTAPPGWFDRR